MAAPLLIASPLMVGSLSPQSSGPDEVPAVRRLRVGDPAVAARLQRRGARLVEDYGGYRILELDPSAAAEAAAGEGVELLDAHRYVLLNTGAIDTGSAAARAQANAPPERFAGRRLHLVQLVGPTRPEWHRALADTGVRLISYVPHDAYLVYGDEASLGALRALRLASRFVQWEAPYRDRDKIQPPAGARSRGAETPDATALYAIQLVSDPGANAATLQLLEGLRRGAIRSRYELLGQLNLVVPLDAASVETLAARPDLVSIRPFVTPQLFGERQSLIVAGDPGGGGPGAGYLSRLAAWGFSQQQFTTSGFAVDVSDSGVDDGTTSPNHFGLYAGGNTAGASRVAYNRIEGPLGGNVIQGCDGHGTINAHIIAGYDDQSGFPHADAAGFHYGLGVAPFVKVGSSVIFAPDYTFPDFIGLHHRAYQDGARISSNSWGGLVSGAYDGQAQLFDVLTRDAQVQVPGNQEMVMVVASGNEGPASLRTPGTAKNVLTVGASENVHPFSGFDGCGVPDSGADSADDIADFSSGGPTADQRKKPDLVAPGTHVSGGVIQAPQPGATGQADGCFDGTGVCGGVASSFFPAGQEFYTASSGTSHSTPAVAGGAALVRQRFINQALPPPSPAMTKAYLMSSARYLTGSRAGDDLWSDDQGMGIMDLGVAFDGATRILRDQVPAETFTASGQVRSVTGVVADPARPFRVTLAWTDAPGSTVGDAFNNDLDLAVTLGGTTYRGNVFAGAHSSAGGSADPRNNVESVFLPAGTTGEFAVTITAANINSDGVPGVGGDLDQDYALVVYNGDELELPVLASAGGQLAAESCGPGNGALDPGELVSVDLAVVNLGLGDAADVVGTLQATGGVSSPSQPQSYGTLVAGGQAVSRQYSFVAQGTCGGSVTATLSLTSAGDELAALSFDFDLGTLAPGGPPATFSNPDDVFIDVGGPAAPYPSPILVTGLTGKISRVTATLHGLQHTYPDDLDVLLVAPDGRSVVLMSDSGNGSAISNRTLVFDDAAAASLPDGAPLLSGTYRPTNWEGSGDDFPAPAPAGTHGAALSELIGGDPNGSWSLYIVDDFFLDGGSLNAGWSLDISTADPVCCAGGPAISVSPTMGLVTTEAGGTASFDVVLTTTPTADVVVGLSSSDPSEGTVSPGSLTFTPGNALTPRTVTVTGADDGVDDGDVAYSVVTAPAASADASYAGLDPPDVSVVNEDDDVVAVSIGDVALAEGDSGTANALFDVTLSIPSTSVVSVSYATSDGTATAGADYVPTSGTLSFPAGTTSGGIPVGIQGDADPEEDETFFVDLSGPVGGVLADAQGQGTIVDDDTAPEPVIWSYSVGVSIAGSSLEKTAPTAWGNAGAVSLQTIPSGGAGYVEYTASESDTHRALGLSRGNADERLLDIDFALYLDGAGVVRVVESGAYRGSFGGYAAGDVFRVSVSAGAVEYRRNGSLLYTSGVTPLYPLGADAALYTEMATLSDVVIAGAEAPPPPPPGAEPVIWTGDVGVLTLGTSLEKTAASAWGDGGAVSAQVIPGDGFVEFTASEGGTYRAIGLSWGDTDQLLRDIDFAVYLHGDGSVRVVEGGTFRGSFGPYATGEVYRVSVASGTVRYARDGVVFYTSTVLPNAPLVVDAALYTKGATLTDVYVGGSGAPPPPPPPPAGAEAVVWTGGVGVVAVDNSLEKTAANGWGSGGAVSAQSIPSGAGFVELAASENDTHRALGLSHGDTDQRLSDIDFALYLHGDGTLRVVEGGAFRGNFGPYLAGDRLRVSVQSGAVSYSRNGVVLFTSSQPPTYPLLIDAALYEQGATLTNVWVMGAIP